MKNYYLLAPASNSYRGKEPLTYCSDKELKAGQIVKITLRRKSILGVVICSTKKPAFKVTAIESAIIGATLPDTSLELLQWMRSYYPSPLGQIASHFVPSFISSLEEVNYESHLASSPNITESNLPPLTHDQANVIKSIEEFDPPKSFLLHGETGSGKTRIYIELAKETLKQSRSVLVLTPEISLTKPLEQQFESIFGRSKVICLHSNLTIKERKQIWSRLFVSNEPLVLIGPRSALFAPLNNLGLVVVDEAHDTAYKEESAPYYNSLRVASKMSQINSSFLIYGTGTPLVSEYFLAVSKKMPILRMKNSAKPLTHKILSPQIIDLADKHEQSGHANLSRTLIREIKTILDEKAQVLLFLNKRGSARLILCQSCGWRSFCPNCDNGLTYHGDSHIMQCHTCGYSQRPPKSCPECSSTDILYKSPGTKAVAAELQKLFPRSHIGRFDRDNKKAERIEQLYDEVYSGKIDILVGTQLLSKGHDLPNLGMVAILNADSSLEFPDFTSEERSFHLISQLKGRINRGHRPGKLLLQTYNPKNALFSYALGGNWEDFYQKQLNHRKMFSFPPFVHSLKIETYKSTRDGAQRAINKLVGELADVNSINLVGPTPCYVEKRAGKYHWQIIVSSKNRKHLTDIASSLSAEYKAELDPIHFL